MKGFLISAALLFLAALPLHAANDFCMDCTQRWVLHGDIYTTEASCCMAVDGHCYEHDWIVQANVGFGCRVSSPDPETGGTSCVSDNSDLGCGGGIGGGDGGKTGDGGGTGCVYDSTGWCDSSCHSCTWG